MPTLRQVRAVDALDDPAIKTKRDAMLAAGYAASTSKQQTGRLSTSVGIKRAREIKSANQADSARGLVALGNRALESGAAEIDSLEPREKLAFGLKALETANVLGESVTQSGNAGDWERLRRTAMRRAYRAGFRAALEGRDPLRLAVSHQGDVSCEP